MTLFFSCADAVVAQLLSYIFYAWGLIRVRKKLLYFFDISKGSGAEFPNINKRLASKVGCLGRRSCSPRCLPWPHDAADSVTRTLLRGSAACNNHSIFASKL